MAGPLTSLKVVELVGIGPGPFAAMMLADLGADVVRVDRVESVEHGFDPGGVPVLDRNRRSVGVDLKHPEGVETVLRLVESADALLEGFRPGVTERLGVGPDVCLARNPRLVYGRMTGWGQDGPMAHAAGHDIDYIALAGALARLRAGAATSRPRRSTWSATSAAAGCSSRSASCAAILEARGVRAGPGRRRRHGRRLRGAHGDDVGPAVARRVRRGAPRHATCSTPARRSTTRTSAPTAATSRSARSSRSSTPSCSPAVGLDRRRACPSRWTASGWPALRERFTELFRSKPRDEWCALLEGSDACFAPVLTMSEAAEHPHIRARDTVVEFDGVLQPAPAPRFSRTPPELRRPARRSRASTPTRRWPTGASGPTSSARCARPAPSADGVSRPLLDERAQRGRAGRRVPSAVSAVTVTCPTLRPGRGAFP